MFPSLCRNVYEKRYVIHPLPQQFADTTKATSKCCKIF